jgi:hypothetical protein
LEPAKECVTTHLPNQLALKMDGARAFCPYSPAGDRLSVKNERLVAASKGVAMVSVEVSP